MSEESLTQLLKNILKEIREIKELLKRRCR